VRATQLGAPVTAWLRQFGIEKFSRFLNDEKINHL
jgi:hypothetical protein